MPRLETKELAHAIAGETDRSGRVEGKPEVLRLPGVDEGSFHPAAGLEQFSRRMSPDVPVPCVPTVPTVVGAWLPELSWPARSG